MRVILKSIFTPPVFEDEDKTRVARLVYIYLLLVLFFNFIRALGLLLTLPESASLLWVIAGTMLTCLALLWLLRTGRVKLSAYLGATILWLAINLASVLAGGMDRPIFAANITVLIFVALALGIYPTFGFALATLLAGILLLWARLNNLLPAPTFMTDLILGALTQLINLIAATMYLSIAAHSLHDALATARQTARALVERNHLLEIEIAERHNAENRLKESEARYRAVVENQTEFIVRCKPDGTRTFVNEAYCRYYGLTSEQAISTSFIPLVSEEDRHAVEEKISRLRSGAVDVETDIHRVIRPDGAIGWQEWVDQAIRDESGELIEIQSVGRDITERKRAEATLQFSETRYRLVTRATNDVIWDWDMVNDKHVWNENVLPLFGYLPEEAGSNPTWWGEHIHPQDRERVMTDIGATLRGKETIWADEYRFLRRDGSTAYIVDRGYVVRDSSGNPLRMIGAMSDITERKKAEEALREAEAKYRTLIEHIPNAITYLDSNDSAVGTYYISPQVKDMLGYSPEEWTADPHAWVEKIHPDDREHIIAKDAEHEKVGGSFSAEYRLIARDGRAVWVRDQGATVYDASGQPKFTQGIMIDITASKQAEDEIRSLNADLEQRVRERTAQLETANHDLESFSYSVSHDLRAPLRGIDGFVRIVMDDYANQLDPEAQRYLERVRQNVRQMNQLISDMLAFSRLSRQALHKQLISPQTLVEQVLEELQLDYAGRQVDLIISDLPQCEADPSLLRQVFVNLLSNALKYSSKRAQARIEVGHQIDAGEKVYFVRDNGVGFDMRLAARLFGVFQRLHTESDFEGTGVGLAIVQRIIQRHGGRIWAESEVDKGATFYFTLT